MVVSFLFPILSRKRIKNNKTKQKKILTILSNLYIFFFYYQIIVNCMLYQPLIINISEVIPDNIDLYYFSNQIGAYIYNKDDTKSKVLFYFSGFDGNLSCRFNILSKLKQSFSEHTKENYYIVAIDLPGFGLSNLLKTDYNTIIESLLYCINFYITSENVTTYSIFSEYETSLCISAIFSKLHRLPQCIIHFNVIDSLYHHLQNKYSGYFSIFCLPLLGIKSLPTNYEKVTNNTTQFLFIQNEEEVFDNTASVFLDLEVETDKKKMVQIDGTGITSLIASCNQDRLRDFFLHCLL